MTPSEARDIIHSRIISLWPAASGNVPIVFSNESYNSDPVNEYLSVEVRTEDNDGHTLAPLGSRLFHRRGLIFMQVYVAVDVGLLRLDALMKAARDLFEGLTVSQVYCFAADMREVGPVDARFLGTVSVPFAFDETR